MVKMKVFAKGCDVCGEDRKLKLYATENGVIEMCRKCAKIVWLED